MKLSFQKVIYLTILFVSVASNYWSNKEQNKEQQNKFVEPQPIRVTFDIRQIKQSFPFDNWSIKFESLMKAIVNFMKKFIKVKPLNGANIFPSDRTTCIGIEVDPNDSKDGIQNSDLHIYLQHGNLGESTLAQASPCGIISNNFEHPYFGGIEVNTEQIYKLNNPENFQRLTRTILHEILHIIGFHPEITSKMVEKNLAIKKNGNLLFTESYLLSSAKKYFGCDTLLGVSTDGVHWNPTSFSGEIQSPYESGFSLISIMTVMYLKATKLWPQVNENLAEFYNTRQDKSCDTMDTWADSPSHNTEQDFKCKNGCNFNGICIRGICHCNLGFYDVDCSQFCIINKSTNQCDIDCGIGHFVNPDNTCKKTCPRGFYPEGQRCQICDFSCSVCDGPLKNNCIACQYLSHLHEQSHSCITCENDQYLDQKSKECKYCSPECLSCVKQGECTVCRDGYVLSDQQQCLEKWKFEQCSDTGCELCHYNNPKQCLTCEKGYFLEQNECLPCRVGCASCTKLNDCTNCEPGFKWYSYNPSLIQICHIEENFNCIPPCHDCKKNNRSICTSCIDGYDLKETKCLVQQCDVGFFQASNKCMKCDPSCKECSHKAKNCTKCHHPIKLSPGGKCVQTKSCQNNEVRQLYCN